MVKGLCSGLYISIVFVPTLIEAVCVMKGIQPKRKPDLENKGKLIDDYWSPGQQGRVFSVTFPSL